VAETTSESASEPVRSVDPARKAGTQEGVESPKHAE
jgi:hypothetical protein